MRQALLLPLLLLAACGQAGDLYLPDRKPAPTTTEAPPATTTDSPANPSVPASDAQKQNEQKKETPKSP